MGARTYRDRESRLVPQGYGPILDLSACPGRDRMPPSRPSITERRVSVYATRLVIAPVVGLHDVPDPLGVGGTPGILSNELTSGGRLGGWDFDSARFGS